MDISEHYSQLLGVSSPWSVGDVSLDMANHRVDITVEYVDNEGPCPECGTISPKHNDREARVWRHLDMMQLPPTFTAVYLASAARSMVPKH